MFLARGSTSTCAANENDFFTYTPHALAKGMTASHLKKKTAYEFFAEIHLCVLFLCDRDG